MSESGPGGIRIFEDFTGGEDPVGLTITTGTCGTVFRVVGDTHADTDTGIVLLESDGLSGIAQMTSPNADNDSIALTTGIMFDVGLMGPIVAEIRVRLADLDTKDFFFGFSDLNGDLHGIEGTVISNNGTSTLTLDASNLVGFYLSSELSDDEDWHMVYNGGTLTGETDATKVDANKDAVAGEFDILRLQLDPNGDVTWTINGVQKQFKSAAVSTSTDLACQAIIEIKGSGAVETADLDYFLITAGRDWTV